jgi:hypothetical protein
MVSISSATDGMSLARLSSYQFTSMLNSTQIDHARRVASCSSSKMLVPHVVGNRHYRVAQDRRRPLADYEELKDIIAMLGLEELSPDDRRTVRRARQLERFLTQPSSPPSSLRIKRVEWSRWKRRLQVASGLCKMSSPSIRSRLCT